MRRINWQFIGLRWVGAQVFAVRQIPEILTKQLFPTMEVHTELMHLLSAAIGSKMDTSDGIPRTKGRSMKYEVIVSDLGTMYQGADYAEAQRIYEDYALRSSKPYGRMANKQVMLIDGTMKIIKQHKSCKATGT